MAWHGIALAATDQHKPTYTGVPIRHVSPRVRSMVPLVPYKSPGTQLPFRTFSQANGENMEPKGKTREEVEKLTVIDTWLRKHRLIYLGATRHPFIISIRDGTVDFSGFKIWLGQDYRFVRAFVAFVASVLIKAWKESDESEGDTEVILSGVAALNDEIAWFKKEASRFGVQLSDVVPEQPNEDYCRFLEGLMSPEVEYTVAITAYWAIEAVYQDSFAHCLEHGSHTPSELQEACQRWGNDGFGQYCNSLKNIANRRLEKASDEERRKAELTLLSVLEHEVDFWSMSHDESD